MKYVVTVWQSVKYRGVIEAKDRDEAYEIAEDLMTDYNIEDGAPQLEWVNEDIDYDVREYKGA